MGLIIKRKNKKTHDVPPETEVQTTEVKKYKPIPPSRLGKTRPISLKYKRLFDLGEERKAIIDTMFYDGKPVSDIIFTLQEGWRVFTDIKASTLSKFLYRYKWEVIDKGLAARVELLERNGVKAKSLSTALGQVKEQLDVLEELGDLVTVQKTRVGKLLAREKDMPMLFSSLGGEMRTLATFLQQYSDLSFDLGFMKRVPKVTKVTNGSELTVIESDGQEQVSISLEKRKQIEEAAQTFFSLINGDVEDGELVGDDAEPEGALEGDGDE